jgi:hypothetical protein
MPTARDRAPLSRRRLLPLTVLIAAAVALLAFAGTALAETKIGEFKGAPNPEVPAEANILGATAEYDSTSGSMNFIVTTAAEPQAEIEGEPNVTTMVVGFATLPICSISALESGGSTVGFPVFELETPYSQPFAEWITAESQKEIEGGSPANFGLATKTVEGTKTTLTAQSPGAVNKPYTCGITAMENVENAEGEFVQEFNVFPLSLKPTPPPVVTPPPPPPAAQPAPAAALSIAKAKKPLKLKLGKWATVKVRVTNTGGTATGPGTLQLKTTKGVVVKPARQKLPALLPGGSWTVSYKVKLTAKAKKSSTLSLVGAAGSLSAKSSLVLKALGG